VIERHDRPGGAFELLRRDYQCSVRFDVPDSTIIVQGMHERDVVTAGRKFEAVAVQMIADLAQLVKISLISAPDVFIHKAFVSMDGRIDLDTTLYYPPSSRGDRKETFSVSIPKLWTLPLPLDEAAISTSQKMARRLVRFNRQTMIAGLEKSLTSLHFVQKAVRMRVEFGELAFLRYSIPRSGSQHQSFDEFRKTLAKDRTDLLLQACVSFLTSLQTYHGVI
jgi:hypothetical protein